MRDLITRITCAKTLIKIDRMPLRVCKTNDPDYIILYREGGDWVTGFYRVDDDNLIYGLWFPNKADAVAKYEARLKAYNNIMTHYQASRDYEAWRHAYQNLRNQWKTDMY